MRRPQWITALCTAVLFASVFAVSLAAQDPPPPPSPSDQQPAPPTDKPNSKKYSHVNDFLIRGTVFTDKALAFPGVQLRIRKAGEKKYRWEGYTNSRGEFAMRVPQGSDYEMVVHTKGFADQTRMIDAKNGMSEESLVFRMELPAGGKG
jgi:hypothetical protein